jgi:hypothetical protein
MKMKIALSASALILACGLAMPAAAQVASNTTGGPATAAGIGNTASTTTTSTDIGVSDFLNTDIELTDNSDNSVNDSGNLAFALGSFNSDSSDNSVNNSNNGNDSSAVVATQTLLAINANAAPLNFQSGLALSDYSSGSNSVNGNAFAAYSGILNQGWNTGINANAQAATNIAARGTVTFSQ